MYLGSKSITILEAYFSGFMCADQFGENKYDTMNILFRDFSDFVAARFGEMINTIGWKTIILAKTLNNEEKAFDLFFALLEEFKLEKESE